MDKNRLAIKNIFTEFFPSNGLTENQTAFLRLHEGNWSFIGSYLDYLELQDLGHHPLEPRFAGSVTESQKLNCDYLKLLAVLYWYEFQVIKLGWNLIEKSKYAHGSKIVEDDTPRKVFYRILAETAIYPIKIALSKEINAGFTAGSWYEKLRMDYQFLSDSLKLEESDRSQLRGQLKDSDTWDWCLHCIWEYRYKKTETSYPRKFLKQEYKNFLIAHRALNGFVRRNTHDVKSKYNPKLFVPRWTHGNLTDSNGEQVLTSCD